MCQSFSRLTPPVCKLRGLAHPLAVGDRVPPWLTIEAADGSRHVISVDAEVRLRPPADDERARLAEDSASAVALVAGTEANVSQPV